MKIVDDWIWHPIYLRMEHHDTHCSPRHGCERIYRDRRGILGQGKARSKELHKERGSEALRTTQERRYLRLWGVAGPLPVRGQNLISRMISVHVVFKTRISDFSEAGILASVASACQWSLGHLGARSSLGRVRLYSSAWAVHRVACLTRIDSVPTHHHIPDCPHRFLSLFQFPVCFKRRFRSIREDNKEQAPHPSSRHPTTIQRLPHRYSHRASRHCPTT